MNMFWHTLDKKQIEESLNVDYSTGLSKKEAERRQEKLGPNELKQKERKSIITMLLEQFQDFMVIILLIAAVISGILGEISDSVVILVVVVLNAVLGVIQENRAEESLAALKKLASPNAKVVREGRAAVLPAAQLVPGDVVTLETGDFVPADIRLIDTSNLKIQEAALTGESVPVEKQPDALKEADVPLGDRVNMAYMSSMVTYGRGRGIVVETGMNTEVGKIADMIQTEEGVRTPLQQRLEQLGKWMAMAALAICALIFIVGVLYGKPIFEMFFIAVSLAVAAIPEGLPAIVTIVLAIGVQRMIRRNAIVRRLPAVETLGSATVICSDKTGTLTQNKMTVKKLFLNFSYMDVGEDTAEAEEDPALELMLTIASLCNDTLVTEEDNQRKTIGDPTETALVDAAYKFQVDKQELDRKHPRVMEIPFDSERKLMTTVHSYGNLFRVYTKGAVDELLKRCKFILHNGKIEPLQEKILDKLSEANEEMAGNALRVLGLAYKEVKDTPAEKDALESDLIFVGMTGMIDPPREEAKEAVLQCRKAGIKPVMITGDHKVTAVAIAKELGIMQEKDTAVTGSELENMSNEELRENVRNISVYARVSPEHKVRIVKAWQEWGDIVAMTGDGVNDAPALKRANIGAAMGKVGTDVAKEASALVITDDNFATIVSAVEEGRIIYANIQKAIQFLISCNIGEILVLFVATMLNWSSPLLPIHILWVNLVTDTFPALALGLEAAEPNIMERKPRDPKAPIFDEGMISRIVYQGLLIGALTLIAFQIGLKTGGGIAYGRTMAFAVLSLSQLTHAFNVRSNRHSLFRLGVLSNPYLAGAWLISVTLQLSVIFIPTLSRIFKVMMLSFTEWAEVIGLALAPLIVVEIVKLLGWNGGKNY